MNEALYRCLPVEIRVQPQPARSVFFKSWTDVEGDRYQQGPGQIDWLWILDVEGHRLVIDATYLPGATGQDRAELAQVVSSIAFKR